MRPEDRCDWHGATVALAIRQLLDGTNLLNLLDSTERGILRRAAELCETFPVPIESKGERVVLQ